MSQAELDRLVTEQRNTWEGFKTKNDEAIAEVKKYGEVSAELRASLKAMNDRFDTIETEAKRVKLGSGTAVDEAKAATELKTKVFCGFLRNGNTKQDINGPDGVKTLSVDSAADGGYLLAPNMAADILRKLILVSPIRAQATVETISQGDTLTIPAESTTNFDAGWVSERGTRTNTTTGQIRLIQIAAYRMYAQPVITETLLEDAAYDVENWMTGRVADRFAVVEGAAFVAGSGVGQPEGLLTNADVAEIVSGSASALTFDGIMDLYHDLPTFYAQQAKFLMNRATMGKVRKLKDGEGDYFLVPNPTEQGAWMILGATVVETPDMPNVDTNTYPIIFGDIARAYTVVDRVGTTTLRDPFTSKGNVLFYTTKRTGGAVVLPEAIRKLKVSA